MRNLLLEVRSVRRCEGGHTCNLVANGRRVAFIGPDIFEWSSNSAKVDVIDWFAAKKELGHETPKPQKLKEGWENEVPDYKNDDKEKKVQKQILKWIGFHVQAYEIKERCKRCVIAISSYAEIFQWNVSPQMLKRYQKDGFIDSTMQIANNLSTEEIVKLLEQRSKNGAPNKIVES
jgi:hypothetical protein